MFAALRTLASQQNNYSLHREPSVARSTAASRVSQNNGPPGCLLLFVSVYHYRVPKVSPAVEGIGQDRNIRLECVSRGDDYRAWKSYRRQREARFKNQEL